MRMQEAEKRMIQDDVLTDDMLLVGSGEFARPRGELRKLGHKLTFCASGALNQFYKPVDLDWNVLCIQQCL